MDNDFTYCMPWYLCCKEFVRWLLDGNHIDQFFHDWSRWNSTVEMLSSGNLLKKWSCRRDWSNSKVLSLHGCSKAWMWTRIKQHKSIIKYHTPHCTNYKNRFEWISWAAIWNWICNLCKRSFLEGQAQNENIKVWCGRLCRFLAHIIWHNSGHDHTLVKSLLNMKFFLKLLNLPP
jgi:hypothetical protein